MLFLAKQGKARGEYAVVLLLGTPEQPDVSSCLRTHSERRTLLVNSTFFFHFFSQIQISSASSEIKMISA